MVRQMAAQQEDHRVWRIRHLLKDVSLHGASLENYASVYSMVSTVKPDECYHLASQSYVSYSFEDEFSTFHANIDGTHHVLAALKTVVPNCRVYFAGSSEMFGQAHETPQTEKTPFHPRSTYGISKVSGYYLTQHYREAYGMYALSGILYNHESPRRGAEFVTRKISTHVAKIKMGLIKEVRLGNMEAKRDWGHARDYVEGMWLMLQQSAPKDYLLATGESHSVRDFCEAAFSHVGLSYRKYVEIDPAFYRPSDVEALVGDASIAYRELGWRPATSFGELVNEMVDVDLNEVVNDPKATLSPLEGDTPD